MSSTAGNRVTKTNRKYHGSISNSKIFPEFQYLNSDHCTMLEHVAIVTFFNWVAIFLSMLVTQELPP